SRRSRFESLHTRWVTAIANWLDGTLPERFIAGVIVHLGRHIEADIAEEEHLLTVGSNGPGGVAVQTYAPPEVGLVIPVVFGDEVEVQITDQGDGARLDRFTIPSPVAFSGRARLLPSLVVPNIAWRIKYNWASSLHLHDKWEEGV